MQNDNLPSIPEIWPVGHYHVERPSPVAIITVRAAPSGFKVKLNHAGTIVTRRTTDPRRVAFIVRAARRLARWDALG